MKRNNLKGQRFGYLEVLEDAGNRNGTSVWLCKCHYKNCENEVVVYGKNLISGATKRCDAHAKNPVIGDFVKKEKEENDGLNPSMIKQKKRSSNSSGFKGVTKMNDRGRVRYRAYLMVGGRKYIGHRFKTPEEAYKERLALEEKHLPPELRHKK